MYPGSFNPPTTAHLAIAEAAVRQYKLDRLDLVVSTVALAKEDVDRPRMADRLAVLESVAESREWLGVATTTKQLLADIAEGYDLLVVGADKWAQIHQDRWYQGPADKAAALARLPEVTIAPRPPHPVPESQALDLAGIFGDAHAREVAEISSSAARAGHRSWMTAEAQAFDQMTGAWSDNDRYAEWLSAQ